MTSDLKSELMEIQGVGDATSDTIIETLEEGGYLGESKNPYMEKAMRAAERGDYREAGIYLRRTNGGD